MIRWFAGPGRRPVLHARFRDVLDGILDAVLAVDGRGRIVFANRATEQVFGYPRGELVGRSVEVLVPVEARQRHPELRRRYTADPRQRPMGECANLSGLRRDGSTLPVEVSLAPLRTSRGLVTITVVRDLTGQHRQQQAERAADQLQRALQASDQRFTLAFDEAPVGMFMASARPGEVGTILKVNPALCRLTGYAAEQLLGGDAAQLLHPPEPRPAGGLLQQFLTGQIAAVHEVECRLRHADGHDLWVEVTASLVRDEHAAPDYFFVSQVKDITGRRREQAAAQQRIERDRQIATVLQRDLLPSVPAGIGPVRVAARYLAADGQMVGGDWHDAFALPDGRIGLAVGDVAGHGIESAVTMSQLRHATRMLATSGADPATVVTRLNQVMINGEHPGTDIEIATLVHAQLDPTTGVMTYCDAGHLPLLVIPPRPAPDPGSEQGSDPVAWPLPPLGNPPLGAVAHPTYLQGQVTLPPASTLIGFTDGLIERRGHCLDESLSTLLANLNALPTQTLTHPDHLAQAILDNAPTGPITDDTAVLVLALPPAPAPPPRANGTTRKIADIADPADRNGTRRRDR